MKRKRKQTLPRITVLALSAKDLQRFTTAVEVLGYRVTALTELAERLEALVIRSERARKANQTRRAAKDGTAAATSQEAPGQPIAPTNGQSGLAPGTPAPWDN